MTPEEQRVRFHNMCLECEKRFGWSLEDIAEKMGLSSQHLRYGTVRHPGKLRRNYLALVGLIALENRSRNKD